MSRTLLVILFALPCVIACPTPGPNPDDGGPGPNNDGGPGGPPNPIELGCESDDACGGGEICDLASGDCVAGLDCTGNPPLCNFCDAEGTGCGFVERGYCDPDAGVCRRSKQTCATCDADLECGFSEASGLDNRCIDGFCAEGCGVCPAGFACNGGGCVPAPNAGSCEDALFCAGDGECPDGERCSDLGVCLVICDNDAECGLGRICFLDQGPLFGQCINGCPFGEVNGAGDICHADGRFGTPCANPGSPDGCPTGTECEASGACGLSGCQDDDDCPLVRTFCDTGTGICVDGCNDPSDCGAFEECENGQCVAGGCRGKDVSCNVGEWCCGTEFFDDAATCPAPVAEGECFLTPDPWCRTCDDDDDCGDLEADFGHPSFCYELQREDDEGNTVTIGKFCSVGCESNADCPRGIACQLELPTSTEGVTTQGCLDARCGPVSEAQAGP